MMNARKQTYQLLPLIMNFFQNIDVRRSCNFVKRSVNLDQTSSPFYHQNTIKRLRLAAIKWQEKNKVVSFCIERDVRRAQILRFYDVTFLRLLI